MVQLKFTFSVAPVATNLSSTPTTGASPGLLAVGLVVDELPNLATTLANWTEPIMFVTCKFQLTVWLNGTERDEPFTYLDSEPVSEYTAKPMNGWRAL